MNEAVTEFLDRGGATQLVGEIKTEVEGIAAGMCKEFTAVIGINWNGSEPPYSQSVEVWDILATDNPIIDIIPSTVYQDAYDQLDAWAEIYKFTTIDHYLLVYAHRKTTNAVPIRIICLRPYSSSG